MSQITTGKKIFERPVCPFCGLAIKKPSEPATRMPVEMPVGTCSCGAVYACDETGHSLGAAMLEALMYACGLDSDLAAGLLPEDDYLQEIVERYDYVSHLVVPGGALEGRRIRGALFFIRLHEDIQEVTRAEADRIISRTSKVPSGKTTPDPDETTLTKRQVESLVEDYDVDTALKAAAGDRKIVRNLQRLLYSGDPLARKRAADIIGQVCAVIAEKNPGAVSRLLQTLFTAVSDTAAFTWGAFEAIGEIIRCKPGLFGPYASYLSPYLADDTRISQAIEAMERVAETRPELFRKIAFRIIHFLGHKDPSVRGNAVRLIGLLGSSGVEDKLRALLNDRCEFGVYDHGHIRNFSVGELAARALKTPLI
jgi:hypothetical protein